MKYLIKGTPWYIHASLAVAFALVIGSFFVPPMAVIDSSILAAIGELIGGTALITFVLNIPAYLEAGIQAKIEHGQTTITVSADNDEEEN